VVSSVGSRITFEKLVPAEHHHRIQEPLAALKDPKVVTGSCCHLMLFVALEGTKEELELPASNLWICDGCDHVASFERYNAAGSALAASEGGFPAVFLSFPSTKDSEWASRFPGKSTAHIIAEARLEWFEEWRDR